uniref:Uncharacterized protein n=1 Tax=viral metagenome TaxID=1070528 RepID=A0A6C0CYA5_9ZZZZ
MDIDGLVVIRDENLHQNVYEYIQTKELDVKDINDIFIVYFSMLRDGYCFTMDRNQLMACLLDITYVLNPSNDNMEIVKLNMVNEDEDDDESESD